MSKKTFITVFGIIVALTPFLGLPNILQTPMLFIVGISIIIIARSGSKKSVKKLVN
jgi:hypothetical protein